MHMELLTVLIGLTNLVLLVILLRLLRQTAADTQKTITKRTAGAVGSVKIIRSSSIGAYSESTRRRNG